MLTEKQWAELEKQAKASRRDDVGLRKVREAQDSVKPMVIEAEKVRKKFREARIPAQEVIAKIRSCEPLQDVGTVLIQEILDRSGELNRLCSFAEQGNFDELLVYIADLNIETLNRNYKIGPSFQEHVQAKVQSLRGLVGSMEEQTSYLHVLMDRYYERRKKISPPRHEPLHPDENDGSYKVITNVVG